MRSSHQLLTLWANEMMLLEPLRLWHTWPTWRRFWLGFSMSGCPESCPSGSISMSLCLWYIDTFDREFYKSSKNASESNHGASSPTGSSSSSAAAGSSSVPSGNEFLTELELRHKVSKLNFNVSYLCLSQKLDVELIQPKAAVRNMINLLNPSLGSDLGRRGSLLVDDDLYELIDRQLSTDLTLFEHDFDNDWFNRGGFRDLDPHDIDIDMMDFETVPSWYTEIPQAPQQHQSIMSPSSYLPTEILASFIPKSWWKWILNKVLTVLFYLIQFQ